MGVVGPGRPGGDLGPGRPGGPCCPALDLGGDPGCWPGALPGGPDW